MARNEKRHNQGAIVKLARDTLDIEGSAAYARFATKSGEHLIDLSALGKAEALEVLYSSYASGCRSFALDLQLESHRLAGTMRRLLCVMFIQRALLRQRLWMVMPLAQLLQPER
jgi:hypothetical protein